MKKKRVLFVLCVFIVISGFYLKDRKDIKSVKSISEPLLMEYYSLLDDKYWEQAKELIFVKEENLWVIDELENIWGDVSVSDKKLLKFEKKADNLYSTKISMEITSDVTGYSEVVNVHPYIVIIGSEFKIITHERDIPDEFGIETELDDFLLE